MDVVPPRPTSVPLHGYLASGRYYLTCSPQAVGTSAGLGTGTMRLYPWYVPNPVTITVIGVEITTAGDAGSTVRLGLYADNGTGLPGQLILDSIANAVSGAVDGATVAVQSVTVAKTLPAGLYWVAAVVQNVTTTSPTVRTANGPITPYTYGSTAVPGAGVGWIGYTQSGVTAALPATCTVGNVGTLYPPRVFVKVA